MTTTTNSKTTLIIDNHAEHIALIKAGVQIENKVTRKEIKARARQNFWSADTVISYPM